MRTPTKSGELTKFQIRKNQRRAFLKKSYLCHISQIFSPNFQSMDISKISIHFFYNSWKPDCHVPRVHLKFQLQTLLKNLEGLVFAILMPFFNNFWNVTKMRFSKKPYFWGKIVLKKYGWVLYKFIKKCQYWSY